MSELSKVRDFCSANSLPYYQVLYNLKKNKSPITKKSSRLYADLNDLLQISIELGGKNEKFGNSRKSEFSHPDYISLVDIKDKYKFSKSTIYLRLKTRKVETKVMQGQNTRHKVLVIKKSDLNKLIQKKKTLDKN